MKDLREGKTLRIGSVLLLKDCGGVKRAGEDKEREAWDLPEHGGRKTSDVQQEVYG